MAKKKNTTRADGRIAVQVYLGRVDGKRKYKTVYGATQKEADEKALEVKLALHKGLDVSAGRDTFGFWCDCFLKTKQSSVSHGQYVSYASCAKHLCRYLDTFPVGKVRSQDIQNIILDLAESNPNTSQPTAKKTLRDIRMTAIQIFDLAIDNRVIAYNPARAVKIPDNAPRSQRRALTLEEQGWITNTQHRAQTAAMIMMYAGLRRGEVIPLTWPDIDLDAGTIQINKSVEFIHNQPKVKNMTKTESGMRVVYIPKRLCDFLRGRQKDNLLVCPSAKGVMMTEQAWKSMWDSYLITLNLQHGGIAQVYSKHHPKAIPLTIPKITAHWLRHTFATLLYLSGIDVLTAKEQLGHADIKTTLQIYTHLDQVFKQRSMYKLDDYLADENQVQVKCKSV